MKEVEIYTGNRTVSRLATTQINELISQGYQVCSIEVDELIMTLYFNKPNQ